MSSTLSLEASRKVWELVGEYEVEKCFWVYLDGSTRLVNRDELDILYPSMGEYHIYAPTFAELIQQVNVLAFKLRLDAHDLAHELSDKYWNAPTEPEGMREVERYLMDIIK